MNAAETIRIAEESGIRLRVEGADLILGPDLELLVEVVSMLSRHKAEISDCSSGKSSFSTAAEWSVRDTDTSRSRVLPDAKSDTDAQGVRCH
jgi:hypothetical protein